jgi:hypothetical protein
VLEAACKRDDLAACDPAVRHELERGGLDPVEIRCNTDVHWLPNLSRYAKEMTQGMVKMLGAKPDDETLQRARHHALGYLVRTYFDLLRPHNLGVVALEGWTYEGPDGEERPLLLFRSGVTTNPATPCKCFRSLVKHGRVRHVFNLYGGTFPFHDMLAREQKECEEMGISYFNAARKNEYAWRALVEEKEDYEQNRKRAMKRLARFISEQLLRPGGEPPRGNLYVHCGGGMHRSGMLVGVVRKCINGDSWSIIEAEYRRHVAWRSEAEPGGFEPLNLRFIKEFDCSLLEVQETAEARAR